MLLDAALLAGRKLSLLTPPNWQSESKRLDTKEMTCFYITSKDQKIVFISLVKIILCSESQLPIFHMSLNQCSIFHICINQCSYGGRWCHYSGCSFSGLAKTSSALTTRLARCALDRTPHPKPQAPNPTPHTSDLKPRIPTPRPQPLDKQVKHDATGRVCSSPLPSEEGTPQNVLSTFTSKPRPESSHGCLMRAI